MNTNVDLAQIDAIDLADLRADFEPDGNRGEWLILVTNFGLELHVKYSGAFTAGDYAWKTDRQDQPNFERLVEREIAFFHRNTEWDKNSPTRDEQRQSIYRLVEPRTRDPLVAELVTSALEDKLIKVISSIVQTPSAEKIKQQNILELICRRHSGPLA